MNNQTVVAVMGPTCAGKSTFLEYASANAPDKVGLVEVGKMLRAKYPPSYFEGQAAPTKTQVEAWELCESKISEHLKNGKSLILVDGQPRSHDQVLAFTSLEKIYPNVKFHFLLLTASEEARRHRAMHRFDPSDPQYAEKLDLANQRITNDMLTYYRVLSQLMAPPLCKRIQVVDTSMSVDHGWLLNDLLNKRTYETWALNN